MLLGGAIFVVVDAGSMLNKGERPDLIFTGEGRRISNSDPVTGQAGWYDVRVRIYKAGADEPKETWPQFDAVPPAPGTSMVRRLWQGFVAGKGAYK